MYEDILYIIIDLFQVPDNSFQLDNILGKRIETQKYLKLPLSTWNILSFMPQHEWSFQCRECNEIIRWEGAQDRCMHYKPEQPEQGFEMV